MNQLFSDLETFQKQRPLEPTTEQINSFWLKKANEIKSENYSDSHTNSIIEDLKEIDLTDSGFEIAKDLDRRSNVYYEFNSDFIAWLENLHWDYQELNTINEKTWVKAHNITPRLKKGDKLEITNKISFSLTKAKIIYITGIKDETAYYLVSEDKDKNGGYVIRYEDIEANCILID